MTQRHKSWTMIVLLSIVGLVAMACQGGTASPSASTSQVDSNAEFIYNELGSEPDSIDPQVASFVTEISVIMKVFDALLTFDPNTNLPIPNAAKAMPTLSSDGKTYTFTLKDGLKYSDGVAVTAKNFEYGFKRLCDPAVAGEYAFTGYIVVGCEAYSSADTKKTSPADLQKLRDAVGVKAIDDKIISYTLTDPAPYFLSIMATWVGVPTREDMVTKGGDKWTEAVTYIGNGPWVLSEWKHAEKMVFTQNPNHDPKPKFAKWTALMINEHAVDYAAYQNNEVDVVGVASTDLKNIKADPDLSKQLVQGAGPCTINNDFNTTLPPFDDVNVRLAFAKSIDRDVYVNDILGGIGIAALSFMPPGFPNYDPEDKAQSFDPTAAKALLAKSKYAADLKSGVLVVKYGYSSSQSGTTRATWFQGQWTQNLGVTIKLDPQDATTFTANLKKLATTPQISRLGWCADYPDPQDWLSTVFDSKTTVQHTGWKNDQFDTLVRAADKEPDPAKRTKGYADAQRILTADAPVGFVYNTATALLIKPWVKNWKVSTLDQYFSSLVIYNMYIEKHTR